MTDQTLEEKANRVYDYIRNYLIDQARSPSRREIIEKLHISTETLAACFNHLEATKRPVHRVRAGVRGRSRQYWVPIKDLTEEE